MSKPGRHDLPKPIPARYLYLGLLLFLLLGLLTLYQVRADWRARVATSRARALYEMVHSTVPMRPTDTPGVLAWLKWELSSYLASDSVDFSPELITWQKGSYVPEQFERLGELLLSSSTAAEGDWPVAIPLEPEDESLQMRSQFYAALEDEWFVVTRRTFLGGADLDDREDASNQFLRDALTSINRVQARLVTDADSAWLGGVPGKPKLVRFFALCEDGTMVTKPWMAPGTGEDRLRKAFLREGRELRKMPKLPSLVSNEFFFTFDYGAPAHPFYSGLYLDLAGSGLITSLSVPLVAPQSGLKGLFGVDIAFDLDWEDFTNHIQGPLTAELVTLEAPIALSNGPWAALASVISQKGPSRLGQAVAQLARQEVTGQRYQTPASIYHGFAEGMGAVVGFPVQRDTWLVLLFPETEPHFPVLSVALLVLLFLLLLAGLEWNRYRAEAARSQAVSEFQEKQNLLNTMKIPITVVDPNTEEIVFGNTAAEDLGLRQGMLFRSLLPDRLEVREHYERMQVSEPGARRAYGLPLVIADSLRYAVIRSVTVTAPIETIHADERHRLGVLFILEPDSDLSLFTAEVVDRTRMDQRNKLAGLLNHGLDTLSRVLHRHLSRHGDHPFSRWLSGYLSNRIQVIAWLLTHWDDDPPPAEYLVDEGNLRATLQRAYEVFDVVRDDTGLRAQLHWNNGVLADAEPEGTAFEARLDWPETHLLAMPVRGGLGFFLHEVLVNAIRHGCPGDVPLLRIYLDPIRNQFQFSVENRCRQGADPAEPKAYGGRALLRGLARLFAWHDLSFEVVGDRFRVSWRADAVEKAAQGQGD
ncbi:hypothetical protein SCOR_19760 [Sulfidibacter corallicola]|uniref:PAS domain-containing protein n=1 Tax=Sulfidibacter corallicola TaxID=2818388 RepID=A0A8A4TTN1_SULCO|nr:hypothetical protein [Sulfidibacter corallicola]QTD53319.1 hypothetical protein J3U87_12765 [Sulfidibacter corallicola]